ncbi:nuclear transport factor 2 family protein [Shuttleworthella satelles]|uniref:nuclear transport factor 2 family protein n=1 Tax=Shuttleworthella satelles TaxID=177972 RepID=UPI0028D6417E|nr:nuclear transport factor 2 family protein [Shuttleworthia satelles]
MQTKNTGRPLPGQSRAARGVIKYARVTGCRQLQATAAIRRIERASMDERAGEERGMAKKKTFHDSFVKELTPTEEEAYWAYRRMMDALCKADIDLLRQLMDKDVRMSGVNGRDQKLDDFLGELERGDVSYSRIDLQKVQVHLVFDWEPKAGETDTDDRDADDRDTDDRDIDDRTEESDLDSENSPGGDDCYATVTGVSLQRARIYGMGGNFHRHFVARLRRENGRWIYIGE